MFLVKLLIFFGIDFVVSVVVGVIYGESYAMACALVLGLIMALTWFVVGEVASFNTPRGRKNNKEFMKKKRKLKSFMGVLITINEI